eukprot:TRINITY_DN1690_c0_g2_i1.p1 TRINITY_DN1690_c0_g2~~TRINITY_DN1690_c0_g2_i1.p1  ORF type:complete len:266 (+),score=90.41 TRINITY_DN1690_c0_g2_i1:41-838(+)
MNETILLFLNFINENLQSLFISFIFLIIIYFIFLKKNSKDVTKLPPKSIKPENTIFAFDLHEVIMQPRVLSMNFKFISSLNGWKFIILCLYPSSIYVLIKLFFKAFKCGIVAEEIFIELSKVQPKFNSLKQFFFDIANDFKPDQQTFKTLRSLKQIGFRIVLFSNIGSLVFEDMKKKHRPIFGIFDLFYTAKQENGYVRKPSPKSYELFWSTINQHFKIVDEQVIFIDDSKKNLIAASKFNSKLYVYHFKTGEKLNSDFKKWKII